MQILYNIILVACKLDEIFLRQNHTTITWPFHDGDYLPYLHEAVGGEQRRYRNLKFKWVIFYYYTSGKS